jgi:hypothetical protein
MSDAPHSSHLEAPARFNLKFLRYVNDTKNMDIYEKQSNEPTVDGFSDATHGRSLSIMEVDLHALALRVRKILALRRLEASLTDSNLPTSRVGCDNKGVIALLMKAHRDHAARSYHVRVQLGFIHDALDSEEIVVYYAPTMANVANTLTAAEERQRFERSRAVLLGMT